MYYVAQFLSSLPSILLILCFFKFQGGVYLASIRKILEAFFCASKFFQAKWH